MDVDGDIPDATEAPESEYLATFHLRREKRSQFLVVKGSSYEMSAWQVWC
jgi:hypothetical protein